MPSQLLMIQIIIQMLKKRKEGDNLALEVEILPGANSRKINFRQ